MTSKMPTNPTPFGMIPAPALAGDISPPFRYPSFRTNVPTSLPPPPGLPMTSSTSTTTPPPMLSRQYAVGIVKYSDTEEPNATHAWGGVGNDYEDSDTSIVTPKRNSEGEHPTRRYFANLPNWIHLLEEILGHYSGASPVSEGYDPSITDTAVIHTILSDIREAVDEFRIFADYEHQIHIIDNVLRVLTTYVHSEYHASNEHRCATIRYVLNELESTR